MRKEEQVKTAASKPKEAQQVKLAEYVCAFPLVSFRLVSSHFIFTRLTAPWL